MDVLLVLVGMAIVVGLGVWAVTQRAKHATDLLGTATQLGLSFNPNPEDAPLLIEELANFALFRRGFQKNIRNVMKGSVGGVDTLVFEYSYKFLPTSRASEAYTVAVFTDWNWALPDFELAHTGLLDKLANIQGLLAIHFDTNPEFSKHYALRSADEQAVRALFQPAVIDFFASRPPSILRPNVVVAGHGPRLTVFQPLGDLLGTPVEPARFLTDAQSILAVFARALSAA